MIGKVLLVLSLLTMSPIFSQTLSELKKAVSAGVKKAEVSIYTSGKPKESGVMFCVEVHTTFSDGKTVIINEEGSYTKYEGLFEYEVTGARSAFSSSESPIFYFDYCEGSKENAIHVRVRPMAGGDWIVDERIAYNCFVDPSFEEERLAKLKSKQEAEERKKEQAKKEAAFQKEVASFSEAERKYAAEALKRGHVKTLRDGQEEVIQLRRRKVVIESVQYWKKDPAVSIDVGNKNKKYVPRSVDTLHYFNESHKNLGVVFDDDRVIRLTSYTNDEEADENGSVLSYGSQLFEHKISTGYKSVAGGHNAHSLDYRTKANIVQYRELESGGFIVVSLDFITIYNDDLSIAHEIVSTSRIEGNKFLDAIRIPDSEDFAVLYTTLSGQPRVSRYYAKSKSLSKEWIDVATHYLNDQKGTGIKYPFTNRIFKADENSFAVFLNMRGASISEVSKFKFSDLEGSEASPIWSKSWLSSYFLSMSRLPNGKIMVLNTSEGHSSFYDVGDIRRNDLDITVESTDQLMKSLVSYEEYVGGLNAKYFYPQKDGSLIVLKQEDGESDFRNQFVMYRYNADFEFVASYKLPLPFHAELAVFHYGINSHLYIYKQKHERFDFMTGQLRSRKAGRDYNPENNKYMYYLKDREVPACSGVSFEVFEEAGPDVSAKEYFWNLQSLDFSVDREGKYMYMITPTTLQKIDLTDVVLAKPFELKGNEYD